MKLHTSFYSTLSKSNQVLKHLYGYLALEIKDDTLEEETLLEQLSKIDYPTGEGINNLPVKFNRYGEEYTGLVSITDRGNLSAVIFQPVDNEEGEDDVVIHILHDGSRGRFVEFLRENTLWAEDILLSINDKDDHFIYETSELEMLATETMSSFLERTSSKKKAYQILFNHVEKYPHDLIREEEEGGVLVWTVEVAASILKGTELYSEILAYARAKVQVLDSLYFIRTGSSTSRFD